MYKLKIHLIYILPLQKNKFGRNIVETTSTIAKNNDAIFAINGDYYGFREDGVLIRNKVIYRDTATRDENI